MITQEISDMVLNRAIEMTEELTGRKMEPWQRNLLKQYATQYYREKAKND